MHAQTETTIPVRTYQLGGRTFTALPVVARQEKWLWPLIKPLFQRGAAITAEDIFTMMEDSITRIAAILLLADGQTQPEKVRAGWSGVEQLEAWLDETVSVAELGPVVADFFTSGQQWRVLTGLACPLLHQTTGSTSPSAPWPTETSSKRNGSGHMSDSASPDAILRDAGNVAPPSGPSLDSVGSSCPG
jgi:hypothetical protein